MEPAPGNMAVITAALSLLSLEFMSCVTVLFVSLTPEWFATLREEASVSRVKSSARKRLSQLCSSEAEWKLVFGCSLEEVVEWIYQLPVSVKTEDPVGCCVVKVSTCLLLLSGSVSVQSVLFKEALKLDLGLLEK